MKLSELIEKKYNGSVKDTAKDAGVAPQTIRNFKSQGREVLELKNGGYVVLNSQMVIIKP